MSQYALPLSLPPVFRADNFIVSDCNRDAWQWIERWPDWPGQALLLAGPKGCGKSHLGAIWAQRVGAAKGHWLVEDIENTGDEKALLHLLNNVREDGGTLLLTASSPAALLPFRLPDLTSRLLALPAAMIAQPDDEVLAGAMRKQFADRQMKVDEEVVMYLTSRMERSLGKVKDMVDQLDRFSLENRRGITVPFARRMLEELYSA